MSVFVTSDLHLGHSGILFFRDDVNLQAHDENIIALWNETVTKRDTVYVLGDFVWNKQSLDYIPRLKGQINWILGNHDPKITHSLLDGLNINFCAGVWPYKKGVVFTHVPIHPNELVYRNWKFNVHGHIHHRERCIDDPRYYNANIDVQGARPVPFDYIIETLERRNE